MRVILVGHDRGARVIHRVAVSKAAFPQLSILGIVLADIIPTVEQFALFANPAVASRYFHWAFLPNTALGIPMIRAFGAGRFCRTLMEAGAGANAKGRAKLFEAGSVDVYAGCFEKDGVMEATCKDYEAASKEDYIAQIEDQNAGRKLEVPTLVLYSARNLGAMADVPAVWKKWVKEGTRLEVKAIDDGYGHFFLEEAPELSYELIADFCSSVEVTT